MDAIEFIIQRRRMFAKNCITKGITDFSIPPEEVVVEVEKWAEEHRPKTRQEKFLEQFPKAKLFTDGILDLCPQELNESYPCQSTDIKMRCQSCRQRDMEHLSKYGSVFSHW